MAGSVIVRLLPAVLGDLKVVLPLRIGHQLPKHTLQHPPALDRHVLDPPAPAQVDGYRDPRE